MSVINVNLNYTRIYNESETFILYNLLRGTTKSLEKVSDRGSRVFKFSRLSRILFPEKWYSPDGSFDEN